MFKSISVKSLIDNASDTFARFKWVSLVAILKTGVLIAMAETPYTNESKIGLFSRFAMVLVLAVPLTIGIALSAERKNWKWHTEAAAILGLVALLSAYFLTISDIPTQVDYYRCALFFGSAHLIVSFIPFSGYNEPNGFWQFNKTLFLQFLNATLYSVTLFVGLLIAVSTVKYLFNIVYTIEMELDLACLIFSLFHTIFFLSKVPKSLSDLEKETDYPPGLKIFTQYVLLPLEVVYLVILYSYTGKILWQWKLPEGSVTYLVLAFSIAGILALLLLHPLKDHIKERWIRLFGRRFYFALLPLIVLLFVGIFRRINDYGITENRYIVATLAVWLAGITIYFLLKKSEDIRWIPITLAVISFLLAVGPWNIFAVSGKSQIKQFEKILTQNKLLDKNGKLTGNGTISRDSYDQLISIHHYFGERDSTALLNFFPKLKGNQTTAIQNYLESKVSVKDYPLNKRRFGFYANNASAIDITGFQYMVEFGLEGDAAPNKAGWSLNVKPKGDNIFLNVYRNGKIIKSLDISARLKELLSEYGNEPNPFPPVKLTFSFSEEDGKQVRIVMKNLSGQGDKLYANGILLYQ